VRKRRQEARTHRWQDAVRVLDGGAQAAEALDRVFRDGTEAHLVEHVDERRVLLPEAARRDEASAGKAARAWTRAERTRYAHGRQADHALNHERPDLRLERKDRVVIVARDRRQLEKVAAEDKLEAAKRPRVLADVGADDGKLVE
jgi:hypothetical protein